MHNFFNLILNNLIPYTLILLFMTKKMYKSSPEIILAFLP